MQNMITALHCDHFKTKDYILFLCLGIFQQGVDPKINTITTECILECTFSRIFI